MCFVNKLDRTGASFERWWRQAARDNPKLLMLTREELMRHEAAGITSAAFPKTIRLGGVDCSAAYLHSPGDARDGVTVTVPLFVSPGLLWDRAKNRMPSGRTCTRHLGAAVAPVVISRACCALP